MLHNKFTHLATLPRASLHSQPHYTVFLNIIVLLHNHTWICEIDIFILVHKTFIMSITHIDNIGIPKHKKHLWLLSSGTKLFITFEFKGFFDIRKREAQSFYDDFSICSPSRATPDARPWWVPKVNRLLWTLKLDSLTFLKSPKSSMHASRAWRHSHSLDPFPIWGFYHDISEWHVHSVRAWTPALIFAPN